jgi:pyruvate kinase
MLNKGPHVVETVGFLDDVLRRMQRHQNKKRAMLRKLAISDLSDSARHETHAVAATRGLLSRDWLTVAAKH